MITLDELYYLIAEGFYNLYTEDGEFIVMFRISKDDKLTIEETLSYALLDTNIVTIDGYDIYLDI